MALSPVLLQSCSGRPNTKTMFSSGPGFTKDDTQVSVCLTKVIPLPTMWGRADTEPQPGWWALFKVLFRRGCAYTGLCWSPLGKAA